MAACNAKAANHNVEVVSPQEFQTRLSNDSGAYLIDVRKPDEYAAGHLKNALLLNWLDADTFRQGAKKLNKSKTIYLYCRSGRRSNQAANYLAGQGFKVVDMDGGILAWNEHNLPIIKNTHDTTTLFGAQGIKHDSFTTNSGKNIKIHFIKHASLIIEVNGMMLYIDPTAMYGTDFTKLPKADAVMVTHQHPDHFDINAITALSKPNTRLIGSKRVIELSAKGKTMMPGDTIELSGIKIMATPAYNTTPSHLQFHPRQRHDIGFVFQIDNLRIYVAGDTENIPEMAQLKNIDIAFLPVNQPYTMTAQQAIKAIKTIQPKIVYPYHCSDTDLTPIVNAFRENQKTKVRIRQLQ